MTPHHRSLGEGRGRTLSCLRGHASGTIEKKRKSRPHEAPAPKRAVRNILQVELTRRRTSALDHTDAILKAPTAANASQAGHTIRDKLTAIQSIAKLSDHRTHTARIASLAATIVQDPSGPVAVRKAAIMLTIRTTAADPTLIVPAMTTLTGTLAAQPKSEVKSKLSKRLRHGLRSILEKHGRRGHAALLQALTINAPTLPACNAGELHEWASQAATKLASLPLTPLEWLTVLTNPDPHSVITTTVYNKIQGYAEWAYAGKKTSTYASPKTYMAWNANSLFKRIRESDLSRSLLDNSADVLHISEVKGEPGQNMEAGELRQALGALGSIHMAWNWCVKTPSIHGSAIFSKITMTKVTYGTEGNNHDPEGRTITTYFGDIAQVWTYTPCSSMYVHVEEPRRCNYNTQFREHVLHVQAIMGHSNVLVAGDMNVAPKHSDVILSPQLAHAGVPSTKSYERLAMARLQSECGLINAAEMWTAKPRLTWRKPGREDFAMRLDHLLIPRREMVPRGQRPPPTRRLTAFSVAADSHGSDHRALTWTWEHAQPPPAGNHAPPNTTPASNATTTVSHATSCTAAPTKPTQPQRAPLQTTHEHPPRHVPRAADCPPTYAKQAKSSPSLPENATDTLLDDLVIIAHSSAGVHNTPPAQAAITLPTLVPVTMPSYTASTGGRMPHVHEEAIPESTLAMGAAGVATTTLWDTGAYYNMMSYAHTVNLGLDIHTDGPLPTFALADSHTASCMGKVNAIVRFAPGAYLLTEFMVIADSPYPAILGAHFFKQQNATIALNSHSSISLDIGTTRPHIFFRSVPATATPHSTTMMAARTTVVVPPHTEMSVEVRIHGQTTPNQDTWTLVTDAHNHSVRVVRGFTCVLNEDMSAKAHYYCKVLNASDVPQTIQPDKPLAICTPINVDDYDILNGDSWDEPTSSPGAPQCIARPGPVDTTDLNTQWALYPQLHELDMEPARKTLAQPQFDALRRIIIRHERLWNTCPKEPPSHAEVCDFSLKNGAAFSAKTRPMNEPARNALRKITLEQLEKRIIEPSTSRFSSAVVLVPKKGGGIRFAIDYRALNKHIDTDAYTLPNVDEALASLHGCTFFSALDMKEAFWSVPLAEHAKEYTAFQTPDGLMQHRRMPMGLKTASAVFCRYVDRMLGPMKWTQVLAYVDDLLVFGKTTAEEHLATLDKLFTQLGHYNMTLGAGKCVLFSDTLHFLGHIVDKDGVRPDERQDVCNSGHGAARRGAGDPGANQQSQRHGKRPRSTPLLQEIHQGLLEN